MFIRTDDPIRDAEMYDAEYIAWLKTLPVCAYCDEPIQDEELYDLYGNLVHEECIEYKHKKAAANYYKD